MTIFVAHDDANYTEEINRRGAVQRQFDYFGKTSAQQFGPEAFLVDYGPQRTTPAHFHSVDQFQVFFGAPGARYQRHQIPAVELHYADAFVTYGPFFTGEERMKFFTLRPCQGQFKGEMPSERHKLHYRGRRSVRRSCAALHHATDQRNACRFAHHRAPRRRPVGITDRRSRGRDRAAFHRGYEWRVCLRSQWRGRAQRACRSAADEVCPRLDAAGRSAAAANRGRADHTGS